jgi:hypothetical protein
MNSKKFDEGILGFYGNDFIITDDKHDAVNSPAHYTQGTQEAIDIIEEAIDAAPSIQTGMLQAQVLKYLLRIWHKDNPRQDAEKAMWYLKRLIDSL